MIFNLFFIQEFIVNKSFMTLAFALSAMLVGCGGGDPTSTTAVVAEIQPFTVMVESAVSQYAPPNVAELKIGTFTLKATSGIKLTGLRFQRTGLGNPAEVVKFYSPNIQTAVPHYDTKSGIATWKIDNTFLEGGGIYFQTAATFQGINSSTHQFTLTGVELDGKMWETNNTIGLVNLSGPSIPIPQNNLSFEGGVLIDGSGRALVDLSFSPDYNRDWKVKEVEVNVRTTSVIPYAYMCLGGHSPENCGKGMQGQAATYALGQSTTMSTDGIEQNILKGQRFVYQIDFNSPETTWKQGDFFSLSINSVTYENPTTGYRVMVNYIGNSTTTTTLVK